MDRKDECNWYFLQGRPLWRNVRSYRDYATINELICLSNMENINAVLINDGVLQGERLVKLNQIAIQQMQVLEGNSDRKLLK